MDRELIDHVWSILPKEFKDAVRDKYDSIDSNSNAEKVLESIFGLEHLAFHEE